ncbi:MAG: hypothetical protein IKJ09_00700 [Bacteroidaceae bacterium]|nr:hypothetical protein [Bacteroidaceae bacterium]
MKKINELFDLAGYDGCKHIVISSVLAAVLSLIVPHIVAVVITFGVGWAKEMYDQRGHGQVQTKDVVCNLIGAIIGIL